MAERFSKVAIKVASNEEVAPGHFVTTFEDGQIGSSAQPGQFFQIRLQGPGAPFLPRPLSIFDWHRSSRGEIIGFKVLYKVIGDGTAALSRLAKGDEAAVTGPLGNSFEMPGEGRKVFIVAGGIGIAPFMALSKKCIDAGIDAADIELFYGARTQELLVEQEAFSEAGIRVSVITDDGSSGRKGTALELLEERLVEIEPGLAAVYASGPTPMLNALAVFCRKRDIAAQLSLEARMICGIAVCNSCAIKVVSAKDAEGWEYKLVCRDGPIFDARSLYINPQAPDRSI